MDSCTIRRSCLVLFTGLVCVLAGALAGFLGILASLLYGGLEGPQAGRLSLIGMVAGGAGGVWAGLIWCRIMWRWIATGRSRPVLAGALWGVAVGLLGTIVLHASLILGSGECYWEALLLGLAFGLPAGLMMGAICAAVLAKMNPVKQTWSSVSNSVPDDSMKAV